MSWQSQSSLDKIKLIFTRSHPSNEPKNRPTMSKIDHRELGDVSENTIEALLSSQINCITLVRTVMQEAERRHPNHTEHVTSFIANRLVSVIELCNFVNSDGKPMPVSVDVLFLISRAWPKNCGGLCCTWDMYPLAIRALRVYKTAINRTVVSNICEKYFHIDDDKSGIDILKVVNTIEKIEKLLPLLGGEEEQPVVSAETPKHTPKRRAVSPPQPTNLADTAANLSQLWKEFQQLTLPKKAEIVPSLSTSTTTVMTMALDVCDPLPFTFPFSKVKPVQLTDLFIGSSGSGSYNRFSVTQKFTLMTGRLPLSVEIQFANAYAHVVALNKRVNMPLLFGNTDLMMIGGMPHAYVDRETLNSRDPLICSENEIRTNVDLNPIIDASSISDSVNIYSVATTLHKRRNYGLSARDEQNDFVLSPLIVNPDDVPIILLSLIDHVAHVECLTTDAISLVYSDGHNYLLNPFLFLSKENVHVNVEDSILDVLPVMNLDFVCLPNNLFIRKHAANSHILLCNNLARYIYLAVSGRPLLDGGVVEDDDDGVGRATLAANISSITVDNDLLDPRFMHMIVCLYFGDCNLNAPEFRSYAQKALRNAKCRMPESYEMFKLECKALSIDILERDLSPHMITEIELSLSEPNQPPEGPSPIVPTDWFASLAYSDFLLDCAALSMPDFPMLRFNNTIAVGLGPHRELLAKILIDLCSHTTFFLDINTVKREIVVRTHLSGECPRCRGHDASHLIGALTHRHSSMQRSCLLEMPYYAKVAHDVAVNCLLARVELPVTFGMSALVATLGIEESDLFYQRIEFADNGVYARKVFDTPFKDRAFVLSTRVLKTFCRRTLSGRTFRRFKEFHRSQPPLRAYYAMYLLINRSLPTLGTPTSNTLTVEKARIMLISLFQFPNQPKAVEAARARQFSLMEKTGSFDVKQLLEFINVVADKTPFAALLSAAKDYKTMCGSLHTTWSLFGWISKASLVQIGAFLKAMGTSDNLLERCCDSFFAVPDRDKKYEIAVRAYENKIAAGMALNDYEPLITTSLHIPDFEMKWLQSNFWLVNDMINVQFDNRTNRMPVIATCSRSLQLPICVRADRMTDMMAMLLAASNNYDLH